MTAPAALAIPLHRPAFEPEDVEALTDALKDGLLVGDGPRSQALAALARSSLGCAAAFPTTSGTHALELAFRSLQLQPGDEVVCPSFTFVSVPNAILLAGARPVFADVDPDTLNLDPVDVRKRLTPRTRAIVTAHYAGVGRALEGLSDLTHANERVLIEDAAHALGGSYLGRPLGTWGLAGAFSFHGTKNIVAGEGGMMITSDPALAARAEIVREKGTDRSQFLRGFVDKYTWQAVGSSYLMSDLLAALVASQWRRMERLRRARAIRFQRYQEAFAPLAADGSLRLPVIPVQCEPAYHIYFCRVDTASTRGRLITALRAAGIEASSHFVPLHTSPYATAHLSTRRGDLPVTEEAAETILRLPLYPHLSDADQATVIDQVLRFFGRVTRD